MEILRRTAVVNIGVPHRMLQDAVINGYFLPKNATVISNIFSVHNNLKTWGDPENFRPERFISEDGTKIVRPEEFIPFSSGKRVVSKSLRVICKILIVFVMYNVFMNVLVSRRVSC